MEECAEDNSRAKQRERLRMWALLDEAGVSTPPGPRGIPEFEGTEQAAERLASLPEWKRAGIIKVNPDRAQQPVRARALAEGKLVYMAVPKLAADHPFVLLDPSRLSVPCDVAARKHEALREGEPAHLADMPPIELVVVGSVAVSRSGARLGKGAGYTDIELGLLTDARLVDAETPVATTVHDLQVVEGPVPRRRFDFEVSVIVTPTAVLRVPSPQPSPGIVRGDLDPRAVAEIPVLASRYGVRDADSGAMLL